MSKSSPYRFQKTYLSFYEDTHTVGTVKNIN